MVNNYLCIFFNHDSLPRDEQTKKCSTLFFKLPFISPFSCATQRRIKVITKKYCKDLDIRLVFTSYKLKNRFGVRISVPNSLRSLVVYKFLCAGCGPCYVGETARHFPTRVREHFFQTATRLLVVPFWIVERAREIAESAGYQQRCEMRARRDWPPSARSLQFRLFRTAISHAVSTIQKGTASSLDRNSHIYKHLNLTLLL